MNNNNSNIKSKAPAIAVSREAEEARILELVCDLPGMQGVEQNWGAVMDEFNRKLAELRALRRSRK